MLNLNLKLSNQSTLNMASAKSLLALSCFGLLMAGTFAGCANGGGGAQEAEKTETLKMAITQVDQRANLNEKVADGQFLVVKLNAENLSNETIVLDPGQFMLQNITTDEKNRYSQPMERGLIQMFMREYGQANKDKLLDFMPINLYPRLQLERYLIFMVPSKAKADEYQIHFKPNNITVPLVSPGTTIVNDHRNEPEGGAEPAQPQYH